MPPLRTLHAAGNYRDLHPLAKHPAVDAIEADVWVAQGHLYAHHERPLGWLPLWIHRGGIMLPVVDPIDLEELLVAVRGHCGLVLDLRSWFGDPAPDVTRELAPPVERQHISVTCEAWKVADRLMAWLPELRIAYSIRCERDARRYVQLRLDGAIPEVPIAIRHTLLHHQGEVEALRHHAGRVAAWTVDDVDRAIELASWGVDEIVSNQLNVLNSI